MMGQNDPLACAVRIQSTVFPSPPVNGTGSMSGNRERRRVLSAWLCGTSPLRFSMWRRSTGRPTIPSRISSVSRSEIRLPKARFTGSGLVTSRSSASVIVAQTVPTNVKSRLCVPSPCTVAGSPRNAASTKAGITAAYTWPAGCIGPNTLKNLKASTGSP